MPRTKNIITLDRIPESIDQHGTGRILRYDLNLLKRHFQCSASAYNGQVNIPCNEYRVKTNFEVPGDLRRASRTCHSLIHN
ncbi:MAG: hypothetical protein QF879_16160 [Candidatus Latescibacteria bacterium]|nr:hypothetical protein [Candidatus Latescibacterota bacterium]MDP7236180.1 hypothetical protein [Candidatus Latescibacterota bacterium]